MLQVFTIAAYSLWLVTCLAVTLTEAPLANYIGQWFCDASLTAVSIGLYIATWLRLAIAVFRPCFIFVHTFLNCNSFVSLQKQHFKATLSGQKTKVASQE